MESEFPPVFCWEFPVSLHLKADARIGAFDDFVFLRIGEIQQRLELHWTVRAPLRFTPAVLWLSKGGPTSEAILIDESRSSKPLSIQAVDAPRGIGVRWESKATPRKEESRLLVSLADDFEFRVDRRAVHEIRVETNRGAAILPVFVSARSDGKQGEDR